jgi:peroxiredoxin
MSARWPVLAAVPLFVVAFGTAYLAAAPSRESRVDGALELVSGEPGRTVCLGAEPCLDPGAAHTLFVFFSPRDCAVGLYETAVLDHAYRAAPRGRLNVVGITSEFTREQAEKFARASGITYPLYLDDGRLERYVRSPKGASNRPVSLLVDRRGRVLETFVAASTVRAHHEHAAALARRVAQP